MIVTRVTVSPSTGASQRRNDAFRDQATRIAAARLREQRQDRNKEQQAPSQDSDHQVDVIV
ncbi:MAG: hypothetical protein WC670_03605 [Pseudolabrys sp.]|jgi:hypothetical protein